MESFPDCIVKPPHIVADPCQPRWVVQCEHGFWFYYQSPYWLDKRNEVDAFIALTGLIEKVTKHEDYIEVIDAQNV